MDNTFRTTFESIKKQIVDLDKENQFQKMRVSENGKSIEDFKVRNFRINTNSAYSIIEIRKSSKKAKKHIIINIEGMDYTLKLLDGKNGSILNLDIKNVKVMFSDGSHRYDGIDEVSEEDLI